MTNYLKLWLFHFTHSLRWIYKHIFKFRVHFNAVKIRSATIQSNASLASTKCTALWKAAPDPSKQKNHKVEQWARTLKPTGQPPLFWGGRKSWEEFVPYLGSQTQITKAYLLSLPVHWSLCPKYIIYSIQWTYLPNVSIYCVYN